MSNRISFRTFFRPASLLVFALALLILTQPLMMVYAQDPEGISEEDWASLYSNWPEWDPEGGQCATSGGGPGSALPTGGGSTLNGHTLPAAKGGTGFEETVNERGQVPSTGGYVTFAENIQRADTENKHQDPTNPTDTSKKVSMQQLYRWYYVTMRWRYVKWFWNGNSQSPGPESVDFYSKAPRVLVTNPRTNKSIIAVVLEAGPAPWTGVDFDSNNNPKQGWTNPQDGTPATYKGRVSGFPPQAIKDLGATMRMQDGSGDDLVYTWAPDQNALPGPVGGSAATTETSLNCPTDEPVDQPGDPSAGVPKGKLVRNSDNVKCEAGTDAGVADGYAGGKKYRIRLCRVHGFRVNTLIAVAVNNMYNLAKQQNKKFTGGAFRTMEEQIHLRKVNGCPDIYNAPSSSCDTPTARPGYSNHQMGLAMDISYNGNLIRSRSNPGFVWLRQNAGKFGFKNFPKEAWHWSVDGK